MAESPALLECRGLTVRYGPTIGLREVDLDVRRGELVAVIGSNGAGKSSLINGISRLAAATGSISLEGNQLINARAHDVLRMGIALVPERRQIFPSLTVKDNLLVGGHILSAADRIRALDSVFARFPLLRDRRHQVAGTLSGGEQQILAIGRAVMTRPRICLLDEPSLGLAPKMVDLVMHEVARLREDGMTLIVVEQLASIVLEAADRGYVLEHGRVQLDGPASFLRGHPEVQRRYLGTIDLGAMEA